MLERLGMLSIACWRRCLGVLLTSLFVGLFVSVPAMGEGTEGHSDESAHDEHKNLIVIFVGRALEGRRDFSAALGLDYLRRFGKSFGIGALAEHTFDDIHTNVYAVPFAYHTGPWKTYLAPGLENTDEGNHGLIRIGAEYGFEVGTWEIAPQVDIDFVEGHRVLVIGVTFGKGF